MNVLLRKALFIIAGSAVIFAAGCKKKPVRPDPQSTLIGQTPGGNDTHSSGLNTTPFGDLTPSPLPAGLVSDTGSGLQLGTTDASHGNQIRDAVQSVYFAFDQSAVRQEERAKIQDAQNYLNAHPDQRVLLEGRCDWRGTAEYNLGLGDRRANSVRQYLQDLGIAANRIEILSKGDLEAVENADAATAAKDRRVDFVFIK
ncbi:flagellar motor protein MotB [Opitutaceae bacterium TAV4]|uniref:OmpA family protein n=1 Tax=Geminisphaera colitermitum TaxID=1148786 RepID=UPI000158CEEF|nr:OmpA family protein [Geminisphaera colitermitum]RRJ95272.1 flagellar motor protein MotB [Opitutaceae bacterium TAV4]RRJ99596.1 flagellar motor protein MotB [Opitutaceae bacterium TAV3]